MTTLRNVLFAILLGASLSSLAWGQDYRWNDNDINRTELRNFNGFFDSHPGIAQDLRQNPGLAQNPEYLYRHPELRQFIGNHPGVREELRENPYRFVGTENRWDRREDRRDYDRWRDRDDRWRDRDYDRDDRRY